MTPVVTFFNCRAGVGTTSLVYHLAWMYAEQGTRVLVADLDPQMDLTARLLPERETTRALAMMSARSVDHAIRDAMTQPASLGPAHFEGIAPNLFLLVGAPGLATLEDQFAEAWIRLGENGGLAINALAALWRVVQATAATVAATIVLVDVGSGLGALNRAALLASEHVVLPLSTDLFSARAVELMGPWMDATRTRWRSSRPHGDIHTAPEGNVAAAGYVVTRGGDLVIQRLVEHDLARRYATYVVNEIAASEDVARDPHCLGVVKDFRSLVPLSAAARKPVFMLGAADGALGSHVAAVQQAYADYEQIAARVERGTWRGSRRRGPSVDQGGSSSSRS